MRFLPMAVYSGEENYIFVSYSHKDTKTVLPMINDLQAAGFRVWYDSGIEAGTEWPEFIERHIINSYCMLVCISESSLDSMNCRNEVCLASTLGKKILTVYLEKTELRNGMQLMLNSQQSLFKYRHMSHDTFMQELINAEILSACRVEYEKPASENTTVKYIAPSKTNFLYTTYEDYISKVRNRLAYPKIWLRQALCSISGMLFLQAIGEEPFVGILLLIAFIVFGIKSFKLTRQFYIKNRLFAFIAVFAAGIYYSLLLAFLTLTSLPYFKEWKRDLARYDNSAK